MQEEKHDGDSGRNKVLEQFRDWVDLPMLLLGFGWLILLIIELTYGLTSILELLTAFIWVCFLLEFIIELSLSGHRTKYLRQNWLTVITLLLPALRILRIARVTRVLRVTRAVRGLRLAKIIGSLNRTINGLKSNFSMYGAGYVATMSIMVTIVGAAGMYAFESNLPDGPGMESYGDALWWTAMIMTTIGSQYWPRTAEGRILGFLLSLYAFGVFGYVAGALASFFVGRNRQEIQVKEILDEMQREICDLREELAKKQNDHSGNTGPGSSS